MRPEPVGAKDFPIDMRQQLPLGGAPCIGTWIGTPCLSVRVDLMHWDHDGRAAAVLPSHSILPRYHPPLTAKPVENPAGPKASRARPLQALALVRRLDSEDTLGNDSDRF